jgi:hypothetical protein
MRSHFLNINIKYFDRLHFPDMLSILEQNANYRPSICSLFPFIDYMLLKPRHVSVTQDHILFPPAYFPKIGLRDLHILCVSVNSTLLHFECRNLGGI